jgi:fibronectin type 3 domain-containing protein
MVYDVDKSLSNIKISNILPTINAIGFEWDKIKDYRIDGIHIYKENQDGLYERISTVGNPYATHFVDTNLKPSTLYRYKFSTYSLGKESLASQSFTIKTLSTFEAISFVKAYKVSRNAIKILWQPHSNPSIKGYAIERSLNGRNWEYIATVQGKLMVEYIDTFVRRGVMYNYRVIAQSYDGIKSIPSVVTQLAL